jgi:multidrug efflux pump subunit AcrB
MRGLIAWFARNGVAANLLLIVIVGGGLLTIPKLTREIFPSVSSDMVTVTIPYPGASPEEVEEGVCVPVEQELDGLDGVRRVTSTAVEGLGVVTVEAEPGADVRKLEEDIKTRVDAIDTFPENAETPVVQEVILRRQVLEVAIYGDADPRTLRELGEEVRDEITRLPGITYAVLTGVPPYEISIEVSEEALRRYRLTFDDVARAIRRSSLDLPGGAIRTPAGEILLRAKGQGYRGKDFERIVLLTRPDGTRVRLGDVARVVDGFAETDQEAHFDGERAAVIQVFRVGNQDAVRVARTVREYVQEARERMPDGIRMDVWMDRSVYLKSRMDLLLRNGRIGFVLVFLLLALFLRFRLAFWVALGIPVSFLGAIWLLPALGVTINIISLFAFILVLGIVVDDAIVVGENVHRYQEQGLDPVRAAIRGTQEVSIPVIFGVLTTVAAFLPLMNVTGVMGKIWRMVPLIVVPTLLFSLMESQLVLPSHLTHMGRQRDGNRLSRAWRRFQTRFAEGLQRYVRRVYDPSLEWALRWRYLTIALFIAAFFITVGILGRGLVRFIFFPTVESDYVTAELRMPDGTPVEATRKALARIEEAALRLEQELEADGGEVVRHVLTQVGDQPMKVARNWDKPGGALFSGSNLGEVILELELAEHRKISSDEVVKRWRELVGGVPGAEELSFTASLVHVGEDINVQLSSRNVRDLVTAAAILKEKLAEYPGTMDIADSYRAGRDEIKLRIKPQGEALGLSLADLARQVRQAFYGEEVQRIQRGRDEIKVMVRYPEEARRTLASLQSMRIRLPDGTGIPFAAVAEARLGKGYALIQRADRKRILNVTANVDPTEGDANAIVADIKATVLPDLIQRFPGLSYTMEGQQRMQAESMADLTRSFLLAILMIYALMAIPFRSYVQPFIVLSAVPFGFVGAVWGHVIMGKDLSIMSVVGLVALTGVVVNDSIVLVDFINRKRQEGIPLGQAVREAGVVRFRPILLTSLTTFAGLTPLLLEKSMQAQFLIPMAISLAFGVLFATFVSLVLVPCGYMVLEDVRRALGWRPRPQWSPSPGAEPAPGEGK